MRNLLKLAVCLAVVPQLHPADEGTGPASASNMVRRLNRTEYNNTVRDLLGVDLDPAAAFPQDDAVFGFDNIGNALTVSPLLFEKYMDAAEKLARAAVFGPDTKVATVRKYQNTPRRFEGANPLKITTPAYFSMENYDETGVNFPGALHYFYKVPVTGDYNITIWPTGGWPNGTERHEMDLYIDNAKHSSHNVQILYTQANERVPVPVRTHLHLTQGEHYFIAALPKIYEGLPATYKGPNPSPKPVQARNFTPSFDPPVIGEFSIEGPFNAEPKPSPVVMICAERTPACERNILTTLAARAFRRALSKQEADRIVTISADARKRGRSFEEAVALGIEAILVSPDFLFRINPSIATRLSYFLWSTMPDAELTNAKLSDPAVLEKQVRRMLADPRSIALARNFAHQWLETRRLESVTPDRDTFPDFDDYLRYSMQQETELFIDSILRENRPVTDLIDAPYSFMNQRLAQHYGLPNITGHQFRKVDLTGTGRAGLLTQASVLTVSSYANRTSPVLRGKWVLDNLLNTPPPPPPPGVPVLEETAIGKTASLRQQMEAHRTSKACAACHQRMDPLGFSLENYNGVGEHRTKDGDFDIDASGALPDGREFEGAAGLRTILASDPLAFKAALTEKLFIYALGRNVTATDKKTIQQIASRGATLTDLILGIVKSDAFRSNK